MPIRVFISHSHEDYVLSKAVSDLLIETLGLRDEQILNTSQASTGLLPGSNIHEELRDALSTSEVVLVLVTPASGNRSWIQFEAGGASAQHKPIYVLMHPAATPPDTLPNKRTIIDRIDEVANLLDAIRTNLKLELTGSTAKVIHAVSAFVAEAKAYNPERTILHFGNRLEVQIGYGDLFDWPGPIALPCDNRFDLKKGAEGSPLYERNLVGQFRNRFLSHYSREEFCNFMMDALGGPRPEGTFPVGHVSITGLPDKPSVKRDPRTLFLVVLFSVMERSGVTEGASNALDVWHAYESLWRAVVRARPESIASPLLGSGQSGTGLSRQQSCSLALLSAMCVALQQPVYSTIHLLCSNRESYRALNLRAIAEAAGLDHGPRG